MEAISKNFDFLIFFLLIKKSPARQEEFNSSSHAYKKIASFKIALVI